MADGRPCLVVNRIPQFIHQVANDQRQNRPSIKVHPEDDQADVETAKVLQGGIRHIENASNADVAYDTAFDSAATGGFGFFRVNTAYTDPFSFNQDIQFKRLRNPMQAYLDPSHQEPDGSDANYGFVWEDLQQDEFKALHPNSELAGLSNWNTYEAPTDGWVTHECVRVVEYFEKEFREDTLLLLSDGSTVLASEYKEPPQEETAEHAPPMGEPMDEHGSPAPGMPQGQPQLPVPARPTIVAQRKTKIPVVRWYKINGLEILEETEWPCEWIPIIPVYGSEYVVNGKVIREGVIRHAKDSQRMYNYWASAETETIALAPRAPFIGAEGQFEGHEKKWQNANRRNIAFLEYKPKTVAGQLAPPPQRQPFEPPVQAITQAKMFASDDMKATTGIYDSALGNRSNENSGVAIQRRNMQSQTSNFHLIDNLTRSLKHAGRIAIALIPKVYDTKRLMPVIDDEGNRKLVTLNFPFMEGGKQVVYDVTRGRYGVTVDVGPSFATKRQEAASFMQEMVRSYPPLMQMAGDLLVKNMDVPGSDELSQRIKKTLPPGLAEDDKDAPPIPPQMQAKMQQMGQMVQKLTETVHEQAQVIETKKMELESRERIEMAKIQANIAIEDAKLGSQEAVAMLEAKFQEIEHRMSLLDWNQPFDTESSGLSPVGGSSADMGPGQPPTGGAQPGMPAPPSPGQSMEQSNVDPGTF